MDRVLTNAIVTDAFASRLPIEDDVLKDLMIGVLKGTDEKGVVVFVKATATIYQPEYTFKASDQYFIDLVDQVDRICETKLSAEKKKVLSDYFNCCQAFLAKKFSLQEEIDTFKDFADSLESQSDDFLFYILYNANLIILNECLRDYVGNREYIKTVLDRLTKQDEKNTRIKEEYDLA